MKIMKYNHEASVHDEDSYEEVEMTAEEFVEEWENWMSSGQGPSSWGIDSLIGDGWKGAWFKNSISKLTPDEKREVWKEMNTPEPLEIARDEWGGWSASEIQWFAEQLGIKIEVSLSWKELA